MARRGARAAGAGMGRCSEDRKRLRSDIPDAARWARREPSRGGRAFQRPMSTSSRTARGCEKSRLVVSRVGLSTENGLGPARLGCGHARRVRGDDDGGQAGAGTVRTWLSSRNTLGAVPPGPFGSVRLLESSSLVLFSVACSRDAPAGWRCAHPPYESRVLHRTPQSSVVPLSYPFHHEEARAARSDDIMHKFPRACCGARRRRRDQDDVRRCGMPRRGPGALSGIPIYRCLQVFFPYRSGCSSWPLSSPTSQGLGALHISTVLPCYTAFVRDGCNHECTAMISQKHIPGKMRGREGRREWGVNRSAFIVNYAILLITVAR